LAHLENLDLVPSKPVNKLANYLQKAKAPLATPDFPAQRQHLRSADGWIRRILCQQIVSEFKNKLQQKRK